jgi:hypothetical protein
VVDEGGLSHQRWHPVEANGDSNVCKRNNPVFCSHIFFLQFSFNDDVSNSKWIAQNKDPCFVQQSHRRRSLFLISNYTNDKTFLFLFLFLLSTKELMSYLH